MPQINIKQRIALVCFGIFLTLAVLEISLRAGGMLFTLIQESRNRTDFSQTEYRILCIGESTTALGGENAYPAQLERLLNQQKTDMTFRVINAGMVSKTSGDILAALPGFLDKYQPHLVVAMIGVNDEKKDDIRENAWAVWVESVLGRFRIYSLFENISRRIRATRVPAHDARIIQEVSRRAEGLVDQHMQVMVMYAQGEDVLAQLENRLKDPFSPEKEATARDLLEKLKRRQSWLLVQMARQVREQGDEKLPFAYLQKALFYQPDNYGAYVELGRSYKKQDRCLEAVPLLEQAVRIAPDTVLAHMELAGCYD